MDVVKVVLIYVALWFNWRNYSKCAPVYTCILVYFVDSITNILVRNLSDNNQQYFGFHPAFGISKT